MPAQCRREGLGNWHWLIPLMNQDIAAGRLAQLLPEWETDPLPVYLVYPYAVLPRQTTPFYCSDAENAIAIIRSATD